jgi:two-component system chemotaxis sensor kinase CheA
MDKSKMMQQLMATFLEELEEHVRAFNQDLLALEKSPPAHEQAERYKTLFRTAHSLKGAARSVNVQLIEGACHRLEEILSGVRDRHTVIGAELFSLLFATVDAIEEAGMRLREQQDLADAPLAALLPRLESAASGTTPLPRESTSAPVKHPVVEPALDAPVGSGSVRVPAEKLDSLLSSVGELLVVRRRVATHVGELAALMDFVDQWRSEWKRVERVVTKEPSAHGGASTMSRGSRAGVAATFDSTRATAAAKNARKVLDRNGDHLEYLDEKLSELSSELIGDSRLLEQVSRPLDDEVRRVRMLPFSEACAGLDRMVRDLAQAKEKEVEFVIEGGSVEMDRSILEGLKDPLRHLVRNAIDHGVELPSDRRKVNKRQSARIKVSASLRGAQVEVNVEDDGRGLDLEAIRMQARRRKLDEPPEERDLAHLIFQPGFSTASIITDVSGRGVGLDVVKNRVESLHGTVDLSFTAGKGTRFTLNVPLTLTTLRAVLVTAAGQTYAFAGTNVHKMVQVKADDIRTVAGREVLSLGGTPIPLASLAASLNPASSAESSSEYIPVIILSAGTSRMAFSVDELLTEQEILIKNLGARIRRTPLVVGATLLPSGHIALVLNAANLIRSALQGGAAPRRTATKEAEAVVKKRLLVVEDSVTTRTLMKSILEASGYDVATAVDGRAGWQYLQNHDTDLIVSDVDMPHMDGFELAAMVRASKKWQTLPVVLVTARETEVDQKRGIEVGADAYLVKSDFDQRKLLETITQLL